MLYPVPYIKRPASACKFNLLYALFFLLLLQTSCLLPGFQKATFEDPDPFFQNQYYLLPAIQDSSVAEALSATTIDREKLRDLSISRERMSRRLLEANLGETYDYLCTLPADERPGKIRYAYRQIDSQLQSFENILSRYEKSRRYHTARLNIKENEDIIAARRLVSQMQRERQEIVTDTWKTFLSHLNQKGCPSFDVSDFMPSEDLFFTFYLSLYRYYNQIDPEKRSALIESLQ